MFPLGQDGRVLENNDFMDEPVVFDEDEFGGLVDTDREGLENLWRLHLRVPAHSHSRSPSPHSCSSSPSEPNASSPDNKNTLLLHPNSPSSTTAAAPPDSSSSAVVVVNGDASPVMPASLSNPDTKIVGSRTNSASGSGSGSGAVIDVDIGIDADADADDRRRRDNNRRRRERVPRVKDFSRLWQYRNGRSPRD